MYIVVGHGASFGNVHNSRSSPLGHINHSYIDFSVISFRDIFLFVLLIKIVYDNMIFRFIQIGRIISCRFCMFYACLKFHEFHYYLLILEFYALDSLSFIAITSVLIKPLSADVVRSVFVVPTLCNAPLSKSIGQSNGIRSRNISHLHMYDIFFLLRLQLVCSCL